MCSALRHHAGFLGLLIAATFLLIRFSAGDGVATMGDDSVSYLALAHLLSIGGGDPKVAEWAAYSAHFPPMFPLMLALTGGDQDFQVAHWTVAAFGLAALVAVYLFSLRKLSDKYAAVWIGLIFLLAPTAWISVKGILSESLFLFLSVSTLLFYEKKLAGGDSATVNYLLFGVLLAAVFLTRILGITLMLAYVVQLSLRCIHDKAWPPLRAWLPLVVLGSIVGLWLIWRPSGGPDLYGHTLMQDLAGWWTNPAFMLSATTNWFYEGWIASFTVEPQVSTSARNVITVLGVLGLIGLWRQLLANRLDAWYTLGSLVIILLWVFPAENMRRLLYPIVPLVLVYAVQSTKMLICKIGGKRSHWMLLLAALLPAAISLPGAIQVQKKSGERVPLFADASYSYSDISDYYITINNQQARLYAAKQISVLVGLQKLEKAVPPESKVMWVRPDYVSVIGRRNAVPWFYSWSPETLASEIMRSKVDYLIVSMLYKADLHGSIGLPSTVLEGCEDYTFPVMQVVNPLTQEVEFVLRKVDHAALFKKLS